MRRREFITLLGGGAAAWPLLARAQQSTKLPTVGFLGAGTLSAWSPWVAAFVRLKVDVIVTVGSAVAAVKQATAVVPIVFAAAADPLGSGLVASLARPGGNVTGLSMQSTELVTKRCELLREILPDLRKMAVMGNAGYTAALSEMREATAAARSLGLEIDTAELRQIGRASWRG